MVAFKLNLLVHTIKYRVLVKNMDYNLKETNLRQEGLSPYSIPEQKYLKIRRN